MMQVHLDELPDTPARTLLQPLRKVVHIVLQRRAVHEGEPAGAQAQLRLQLQQSRQLLPVRPQGIGPAEHGGDEAEVAGAAAVGVHVVQLGLKVEVRRYTFAVELFARCLQQSCLLLFVSAVPEQVAPGVGVEGHHLLRGPGNAGSGVFLTRFQSAQRRRNEGLLAGKAQRMSRRDEKRQSAVGVHGQQLSLGQRRP
eukprot:scaffold183_cov249-Pinguiococcus_pyrenoidosus.AAC.19